MDEKITRLEEQIAFLERHVGQLDELVRELFSSLESHQTALKKLREETATSFAALDQARDPSDPRADEPPHWGGRHS